MYTILIVAAIGALVGLLVTEGLVRILGLVFGTFIGCLVGLVLSTVVMAAAPKEWVSESKVELVAFQDGSSISGSFFIGSGSVKSSMRYYCYYRMNDGGIKQFSTWTDNATIYEEVGSTNASLTTCRQILSGRWSKFGMPPERRCYEFHVPAGTVLRSFNADLQ